jgi:NAD(P)-dependent dehydrogenase (short-subunit alcohol dehydrogenase family)
VLESFLDAVVVVTGGASGIGRAIAEEVGARGARVVVSDMNDLRLTEVGEALTAKGVENLTVHCDVTSDAEMENLRDAVLHRFGQVDLLCNNAGVAVLGPPESVPLADWQWILDVNVLGAVRGVQAFVPHMLERGRGHVLNTASIAGVWAYTWDAAPYITSKFAVYGLSEALARRLRPHGVSVSVLCPGLVSTNLGDNMRVSGVPEDKRDSWFYFPEEMQVPMEPSEVGTLVADAVLEGRFAIFTHAGDADRYMTWRLDIDQSLAEVIENSPPPPRL